eukprot:13040261-Alexandrium_andersonii.AAC.1
MTEGGGRSHAASLAEVWSRVLGIYNEQGTLHHIQRVTKEMLQTGGFPLLKRCKAAELAALVPVLRQLA